MGKILRIRRKILTFALLLPVLIAACRKEEKGVEGVKDIAQKTVAGVAQNAVKAEQQAQATATELDSERAQLNQIPLPTKSLYADVREPSAWANPFLSVGPDMLTLRILLPDTNPGAGEGGMLRPEGARRQELEIRPSDLAKAIVAIPAGSWRYGRVIALAESSAASAKDRTKARRNVEAAIKQLNDLGIVVEEWPGR
jgi:hypothetical protein